MAVTRIDHQDLSAILVCGRMIVVGPKDADLIMAEIATVESCWVEPHPRQLLAAALRALGFPNATLLEH